MIRTAQRPALIVAAALVLGLARVGPAQGEKGADRGNPADACIAATQVALRLNHGRKVIRFRASVLARTQGELTILTAAHCLAPSDRGSEAELTHGATTLRCRVEKVVPNPFYRSASNDIPGADNAVAVLAVESRDEAKALDKIGVASLCNRPMPGPTGQTLPVHTIDQFDRPHAFRGGNYTNPKWLEWGPAYKPIEGDSGGGVFVLATNPDGSPRPLLIGTVVVRSEHGGGASLVDAHCDWVRQFLGR